MRPLAALRNGAVPDGGQPARDHRVQQPPRGGGRDRASRSRPGWRRGKVAGLSSLARRSALGALLGALAQIPLGGLTIRLHLHPLAVMSHFLLALIVLALSVARRRRGVERHLAGERRRSARRWFRYVVLWAGLPLAAALVATGAVATASGPHPGSQKGVERLGHRRSRTPSTCTCGSRRRSASASSSSAPSCSACRRAYPGLLRLWAGALVVLVAQMILGEVQYRNALPWGLVLLHVFLAATIWALSVAITAALWRPPAALAGPPRRGRRCNPPHSGTRSASKVSGWKTVPTSESTSGPRCAARC